MFNPLSGFMLSMRRGTLFLCIAIGVSATSANAHPPSNAPGTVPMLEQEDCVLPCARAQAMAQRFRAEQQMKQAESATFDAMTETDVLNYDLDIEVFNIGSDNEISINDLAALVKEMTGSRSEISHIPYDEAYEEGFEDMMRRVPDISKIQALIDYQPTLDIRQILEQVIQEQTSRLAAGVA